MSYDYLNETTYTNDLAQQQDMLGYISSQLANEENDGFIDFDSDLIEIADNEEVQNNEPEVEEPTSENNPEIELDDDMDGTDMELLNFLFSEKSPDSEGAGSLRDAQTVISDYDDVSSNINWLRTKSNNVKFQGLNQNISKYLNTLPDNLRGSLLATSGNDQQHVKNSKHYEDEALDLRFDKQAYDFMTKDPVLQRLGLKVLPPDHGTAPHIHLEKMKYGGSKSNNTLYADSEEVQRIGLNNPNYNKAVLNLAGNNTIRGLDNNQPIAVTDGKKYKVLKGKYDTSTFNGKVYEEKL
jgi:hypothetical protein